MIIINVEVPALEHNYDVQIDENQPVFTVISEIADLVCRMNQCELSGDKKDLLLWKADNGQILDRHRSAWENGVRTGSVLILA